MHPYLVFLAIVLQKHKDFSHLLRGAEIIFDEYYQRHLCGGCIC